VHTVLNVLQFNSVTKRDVYDSKKWERCSKHGKMIDPRTHSKF
jgi:hypothetical protein